MDNQDLRNIEVVRKMYSGDESERAIIAPDIVWHVPGHNHVSRDYHGIIEYTERMPARMAPLDRWDFTLKDVMVNRNYVVATFNVRGERKGKTIDIEGAHIIRLNDRGQVAEGWGFTDDQDLLDDFFSG